MSRVLFTLKYGCYHESRSVLFNLPSAKPNDNLSIKSFKGKSAAERGTIDLAVLESK